jgi:aminoglycoside phosphotransferase
MGPYLFDPKADSLLPDAELREKKDRYAKFDASLELPWIVNHVFSQSIKSFEALGSGTNAFDHIVFRVLLIDGRSIICRLNTDSIPAHHFLTESALYIAWKKEGIPSPEVYATSLRAEKPYDYMVLQDLGTHDLEHYSIEHGSENARYSFAAGEFLATLHTCHAKGFGALTLLESNLSGAYSSWEQSLYAQLPETLEYLQHSNLVAQDVGTEILETLRRHSDMFDLSDGVILHGDYHDANILIDAPAARVVAAIDLTQAKVGDPVFDIAFYSTYVVQEKLDAFIKGYVSVAGPIPNLEKKMALYRLRIYLSKAKLRSRFGYTERVPAAITGIKNSLVQLNAIHD